VTAKQKHIVERTHIQVCTPFLPFWLEGRQTWSYLFESLVTSFFGHMLHSLYGEKEMKKCMLAIVSGYSKTTVKGSQTKYSSREPN
jgi:hypothetical protein